MEMSTTLVPADEKVILSGTGRIEDPIRETVRIYLTEKRLLFVHTVGTFRKKDESLLDAGIDQIEYVNAEGGQSDLLVVTVRTASGKIVTYRAHVETPQVWFGQIQSLKSTSASSSVSLTGAPARGQDVRAKLLELGTLVDKDRNTIQYQNVLENYQNYYLIGAIFSALGVYASTLIGAILQEWVVGIIIMVLFLVYWNYSPRFTRRIKREDYGALKVARSYIADLNIKNIISTQLTFGLICLVSIGVVGYGAKQLASAPLSVLFAYGLTILVLLGYAFTPILSVVFEKKGRFYRAAVQRGIDAVKSRVPVGSRGSVDWLAKWGLVSFTVLALVYSLSEALPYTLHGTIPSKGIEGIGIAVGLQLLIYAFLRSYLGSAIAKSVLNQTISSLNIVSDRIKQALLDNTIDESLYDEIRQSYIKAVPYTITRNPFLLFNFHRFSFNPFYLKNLQTEAAAQ
jgi:hypothetical protein